MIEFAIDIDAEPNRGPGVRFVPGRGPIFYTQKKDIEYKALIAYAACVALGCPECEACGGTGDGPRGGARGCKPCKGRGLVCAAPLIPSGPVAISIVYELRPKPKHGWPDVDNLTKNLFDAFNGILWRDDTQVVDLRARKRVSTDGRIRIEARQAPVDIGD